jgi:hypothetical protein
MTSTLGILLQHGVNTRGVGTRRTEDYTTEALALTIRHRPAPMQRVLGDLLGIDRLASAPRLHAYTQQRVSPKPRRSTAILDLVLSLDDGADDPIEVWVEVKAGSPVTLKQLRTYRQAIEDASESGVERCLIVLGLRSQGELPEEFNYTPLVTWQQLHDAIRPEDGFDWRDFAAFLRERGLANGPDAPSDQIDWLAGVFDRVLDESARDLGVGWSKAHRYSSLRTSIRHRVKAYGTTFVRLWTRNWNTHLDIGLIGDLIAPRFGARLGITRVYPVPRGTLVRLAYAARREGRLPETWRLVERAEYHDAVVETYARPEEELKPEEQVMAWLHELDRAGLLVDINSDGMVVDDLPDRLRFADTFPQKLGSD